MLYGQMMDSQLTLNAMREFATKVHPRSEIVSLAVDTGLYRYTFAEAFQRAGQLANALQNHGVAAGDRIATLAWNDHRHFELYFAVSGIGAVCHTINPRLFPEQVKFIINHAEDKVLFTDPMFLPLLEKLGDALPKVEKIIVLGDTAVPADSGLANLVSYETFISDQNSQLDWPDLDERCASSLCYTSGTTGDPKGVLYSHRSTVLHAYGVALPDVMNLSARDVILPLVPMFHVNAWGIPYSAAMVGSKLVLPGPKMGDGETLCNLIESEDVTVSAGVPTVWLALLDYLKQSSRSVPSLERVIVGGAACPLSIMEEFQDRHGVQVMHAWGMTETSPLGTLNSPRPETEALPREELNRSRAKQGRPVFGIDLDIVGADGEALPWDGQSAGEVRVRGPWVCSGYYRQQESDSHDDDGWFRTGDIATLDPTGLMQITDRAKDVIKSGGEWISSIDLENAAVGHPGVKEAAVIGIPDPQWTERPLLIVIREAETTFTDSELLTWLEGKVASWWIPDEVVFVEQLPHTATGKISKKDLRGQFSERFRTNDK